MADIVSRAVVELQVNGKEAQKTMDDLRSRAQKAREEMEKFAAAGDSKNASRKQKELERYERQMRKLQDSTQNTVETLRNLDKASLKDLNAALNKLQSQFRNMKQGTVEFEAQAEAIRNVKEQIEEVRDVLEEAESPADRLLGFFNKWQVVIMAAAAAVVGLVEAARRAVQTYADMEQEMANVRKFTGMTAEEVEALNDEFRKIDTRTSREDLNKLAQEAGRLGKQSKEDVLGFVRAADKINVALDDLGEGATLTLSKLTGIFGDEARLGTEKALLSVGSIINELSQNCSASAPYIAEFASRMGGVGAQAGMTVQQIMAFAAVLDTNNQKCEASATALSQVIVRIYQDPAKYAKVAGMNVKAFSDLVRTDMNAALIEFLSTLKSAGNMDVLSPMFKDMGENGSRAISAMSTLANHIQDVKNQQVVANEAFAEATSIDTEFAVQNNTVQAGLDKAKKSVTEIAVQLGEKLQPVMRHIISSSGIFLRVCSSLVDVIFDNIGLIATLAVTIAGYNVALNLAAIRTTALKVATASWAAVTKAVPTVLALAKVTLAGATNSLLYFTNGLKVNYAMQERWAKATSALMAANPAKVFAVATIAAVALMKVAVKLTAAYQKQKEVADVMNRIRNKAAESIELEKQKINQLIAAANDETESLDKRRIACQKLNEIIPHFNAQIDEQTKKFKSSTKALKDHIKQLTQYYEIQGAKEELKKIGEELAQARIEKKNVDDQIEIEKSNITAVNTDLNANGSKSGYVTTSGMGAPTAFNFNVGSAGNVKALELAANRAQKKIDTAEAKLKSIFDSYSVLELYGNDGTESVTPDTQPDTNDDGTGSTSTPYVSSKQAEEERKKAEAAARRAEIKARKEFKEELDNAKGEWEKGDARNIAERTQGLKSWTEFLTEKHRLQEKFYDDQLDIFRKHNLEEDEDYQELLKKKEQLNADWMKRRQAMAVDDAKLAQKAEEIQAQIDFATPGSAIFQNEEALQIRLHDIKVKYLAKMRDAYHKDSEEYYRYQLQLTEAEEQNKLEVRKKFAALYVKYSKEYAAKSAKEQLKIQIAMLTTLQQMGVMSMKDYLEALKKLRKEHEPELPESARKPESAEEADNKQKALDIAEVERQYAEGLKTEEEYLKAKERIEVYYDKRARERAKSAGNEFSSMVIDLYDAFKALGEDDGEGMLGKIGHAAQATFALMSSAMQMYSEYSKAELDAQVAKIEKRYEAEAALAEGNVYKQKAAEKKKNKEIAKAKNEANRKQFAMSVIQAVAQTAVNAISAYGAGLKVGGPAGLVLAPIAAAMAIAAGMVQIATLKKQQQASESTGYRQGGFTPKGRPDEAVGVVHAGEWVAPQEIVNNPRTRPIVNLLENVRRSNRMPSISPADVSATVTAPVVAARSGAPVVNVSAPAAPAPAQADTALVSAVSRLNDRLDEPFVTVNTVTGKYGYKQAEDEYDRLIRNKSRKK